MKWHQNQSECDVGEVDLSSPQVRTGSAAAGCLEPCPLDCELSPRTDTPQDFFGQVVPVHNHHHD